MVEFDKTRTQQELAQFRSGLKSAEAEIDQAKAEARLKEEEGTTAVIKARYDLEVARLDASKSEIVSRIEGAEAKLKVADAEQKLREAEKKLASDRTASKAAIQGKIDASRKAAYDVQRTERALSRMSLIAPIGGMVSLIHVWRPEGDAAFKPGDHTWPGAPIAELRMFRLCGLRHGRKRPNVAGSPCSNRWRCTWMPSSTGSSRQDRENQYYRVFGLLRRMAFPPELRPQHRA